MDNFITLILVVCVCLAILAIPISLLGKKRKKLMLLMQSPNNLNYEAKSLYCEWFKNYHQGLNRSIWLLWCAPLALIFPFLGLFSLLCLVSLIMRFNAADKKASQLGFSSSQALAGKATYHEKWLTVLDHQPTVTLA